MESLNTVQQIAVSLLRHRVFVMCLGFITLCIPRLADSSEQPNIIFLFADDMTFEAVNALGNREVHTPNLDRLVHRGTTLTHAYNQGGWNGAVCVASRTMLMTGRYLWHARDDHNQTDALYRQKGKLLPQILASHGYRTYFSGKWHLQADASKSFDVVRHVRPGMPRDVPVGYHRPVEGVGDPWDPADPKFGGFWAGGTHWSEVLANDGIEFIHEASKQTKPVFMYLAFNAPHDPRQSPQEFLDQYPVDSISIPNNYLPHYPHSVGSNKIRDEILAPFPRTHFAVRSHRREYYALVTHLDFQIGRILEALENSPLAGNTYIVFSADHGLAVGRHGFLGKQNMYDHSLRVPLVWVGPGIRANHRIATPVYIQDTNPSILEVARIEPPDHIEFQSYLPLLRGSQDYHPYPAIYSAYIDFQRMIQVDNYKLILYPKIGVARLYDVRSDPDELLDLLVAPEAEMVKKAQALASVLKEWNQRLGDSVELDVSAVHSFP